MAKRRELEQTSFLYGGNSSFIEDLYARYLANPAEVDPSWRAYFDELEPENRALFERARAALKPQAARLRLVQPARLGFRWLAAAFAGSQTNRKSPVWLAYRRCNYMSTVRFGRLTLAVSRRVRLLAIMSALTICRPSNATLSHWSARLLPAPCGPTSTVKSPNVRFTSARWAKFRILSSTVGALVGTLPVLLDIGDLTLELLLPLNGRRPYISAPYSSTRKADATALSVLPL